MLFQRIQRRPVFDRARILGSFIVTPLAETLFIGLFTVEGVGKVKRGLIDPLSGKDVGGLIFYDLRPTHPLSDLRGRLVIDWGPGFRSWVQRAQRKNKVVLELRRNATEPPFPGFVGFRKKLSELASVPVSWRTALSSVSGVYLLVCPESGKQYVGSAYGMGGFWGRWEKYVASGHGGNRRMRDIPPADYQVTILEVASSSADANAIIELEGRWKRKLMSREFGLNANQILLRCRKGEGRGTRPC